MQLMKGSADFNIMSIQTETSSLHRIKAFPIEIYYERNTDPDDKRIQFGIGLFGIRIGIVFDITTTG